MTKGLEGLIQELINFLMILKVKLSKDECYCQNWVCLLFVLGEGQEIYGQDDFEGGGWRKMGQEEALQLFQRSSVAWVAVKEKDLVEQVGRACQLEGCEPLEAKGA